VDAVIGRKLGNIGAVRRAGVSLVTELTELSLEEVQKLAH